MKNLTLLFPNRLKSSDASEGPTLNPVPVPSYLDPAHLQLDLTEALAAMGATLDPEQMGLQILTLSQALLETRLQLSLALERIADLEALHVNDNR